MNPAGPDQFVFAGGGTGGHLFPGLAVAMSLKKQAPEALINFYTTDRNLDDNILSGHDFRQFQQSVRPWRSNPIHWPAFLKDWWKSVAAARKRFQAQPPAAVLGLGGYAAGPAIVAAAKLGIPSAILNPDAVPGKANLYLAKRADIVFQQWEASSRRLSIAKEIQTVGCPIRDGFAHADQQRGRETFALDPERKTLLVTGASQGARTINEAMMSVWPSFTRNHPDWQLLHLTGAHDRQRVADHYQAVSAPATVLDFTTDMADAIAASDVVIARAGASTLAELGVIGRPAILLPYPFHRDQHQRANAQVFVESGAAVLIDDAKNVEQNGPRISGALESLCDHNTREQATAAAKAIGQPQAAEKVAAWMLSQPSPQK